MDNTKVSRLDMKKRRRGFERAANSYDEAAVLQREIGSRVCSRLDYISIKPEFVLDLGCGTGFITQELMQRYPKAQLVGADIAMSMLHKTAEKGRWLRKPKVVCSEAEALPFKEDVFDLVLSSLMLQWCDDLQGVFSGINRVLKPDSLFSFTTFGPDTMKELRDSWKQVDNEHHTNDFVDMHDVGDALMHSGFQQPILDMEIITMTYPDIRSLMMDIKNIGASNASVNRQKGLTGKQKLKALEAAYEAFRLEDGSYPLSYEVIYGHAWSAAGVALPEGGKVIPIYKA